MRLPFPSNDSPLVQSGFLVPLSSESSRSLARPRVSFTRVTLVLTLSSSLFLSLSLSLPILPSLWPNYGRSLRCLASGLTIFAILPMPGSCGVSPGLLSGGHRRLIDAFRRSSRSVGSPLSPRGDTFSPRLAASPEPGISCNTVFSAVERSRYQVSYGYGLETIRLPCFGPSLDARAVTRCDERVLTPRYNIYSRYIIYISSRFARL